MIFKISNSTNNLIFKTINYTWRETAAKRTGLRVNALKKIREICQTNSQFHDDVECISGVYHFFHSNNTRLSAKHENTVDVMEWV